MTTSRLNHPIVSTALCGLLLVDAASAQFGRGAEWTTAGNDAQRTSWVRTDPKISPASMAKPGFQSLWKTRFDNVAKQLNGLAAPVLMDRLIGYKGFRALAFVGGSSDKVFVVDTDLNRVEWQVQLPSGSASGGASANCPGGLTSSLARPTGLAIVPPPAPGAGAGGGRGGPAKSAVGEADQGAVTLAMANQPRPARPAGPGGGPGGGGAPAPPAVYAISSAGMLHSLNLQNGANTAPPMKFLPPNSNASGLIVVDGIAYAATSQSCGGAPNAIWALNTASGQVSSWAAPGGIAGSLGPAFGPDGTIYAATSAGELVALDPATMKQKSAWKSASAGFTSTPVIFDFKGKLMAAVAAKDGSVQLMDTSAPAKAPVKSGPVAGAADYETGALSSWQDPAGTRWILVPGSKGVNALKVIDRGGEPAFETAWASPEMTSALPPMIVNGVVFAVSSGAFRGPGTAAQRAAKSTPAVLYALDGATGKQLWSSGRSITSFVHNGGLAGSTGQLYLGTHDGNFYAFGYPIEH